MEPSSQAVRVLVVDDEEVVVDVLEDLLSRQGCAVDVARDGAGARALVDGGGDWDVVLLDLMLPDTDGLDLLRWLRKERPRLAVVMITAHATVETAVDAMKAGAFHYVAKPFNNEEVRLIVAKAGQTTRLRRENDELKRALAERHRFERIVGKSPAMQEVYGFIEQVAPTRSTVLIQGESGTGKELVAQAIHKRSPRAENPFVVVNSNSIPSELLEDNLFGHAKGAFTGAASNRSGLLEAAERGTVLFDEITTVAPAVQAKLLRVIQEKEFVPLGSVENRRVDVRILAATNEDVRELVQRGEFREDLYYRLNVLTITLPPLRERMLDLPLLVQHFLEQHSAENQKTVDRVAPAVMERFLGYGWPGNVRELENVIERGVVLAQGPEIGIELLPRELRDPAPPAVAGVASVPAGSSLADAVSSYERQLIESALSSAGGVQKRAAEILGLKPTTLHEKLKRLRIRSKPASGGTDRGVEVD